MVRPAFSLIIPAFNAENDIGICLESVSEQSRPVDEVVVVDDGSSDDTTKIVSEFSSRLPLRVLRNSSNRGIVRSIDRGIRHGTCNWILRLDADDFWMPNHVREIENCILRSEDSVMVVAGALIANEVGKVVSRTMISSDSDARRRLMWDNPMVHSAVGFKRSVYESAGGYSDEYQWEDYQLWIDLLTKGNLVCSPHYTVQYSVRENSLSRLDKVDAIKARWQCQKNAVRRNFLVNPMFAAFCLLVGYVRVQWMSLRNKGR